MDLLEFYFGIGILLEDGEAPVQTRNIGLWGWYGDFFGDHMGDAGVEGGFWRIDIIRIFDAFDDSIGCVFAKDSRCSRWNG